MLILFGLILSEQIRFRKIDGWKAIVEVYRTQAEGARKCAS